MGVGTIPPSGKQRQLELGGCDPVAVDFDRDGALQEFDRNYHAPLRFSLDENTLDAFEGATGDPDGLTFTNEGAGLGDKAGLEDGLNGFYFAIGDRSGFIPESDDGDDAGSSDNRKALLRVKSTEYVTREKGFLRFDDSV